MIFSPHFGALLKLNTTFGIIRFFTEEKLFKYYAKIRNEVLLCIIFRVMQWKPEDDVIFLREVLASDLYSTHKGSTERGKTWSQIKERLHQVVNLVSDKNPLEIT